MRPIAAYRHSRGEYLLRIEVKPEAKGQARGSPPSNNTYILYQNRTLNSREIGLDLANFMSCCSLKFLLRKWGHKGVGPTSCIPGLIQGNRGGCCQFWASKLFAATGEKPSCKHRGSLEHEPCVGVSGPTIPGSPSPTRRPTRDCWAPFQTPSRVR